MSTNFNQVVGF